MKPTEIQLLTESFFDGKYESDLEMIYGNTYPYPGNCGIFLQKIGREQKSLDRLPDAVWNVFTNGNCDKCPLFERHCDGKEIHYGSKDEAIEEEENFGEQPLN